MPADTSIGMSQETRDRLDDYRGPGHHSMEDVIEGLMAIVPPADRILDSEACGWSECDNPLWSPDRPEEKSGVIWWWHDVDSGSSGSRYFCSPEHAAKAEEDVQKRMPTEPDKIIVGGHEEMQAEIAVDGLTFHYADEPKQIGIPVPGAFGGDHEYVGEPVYVWNAGRVRQSGVIGDILHEEVHTGLFLAHDPVVEMDSHPDDERRQEWIEGYTHWYKQDCPECSEELDVCGGMGETVECGECGSEIEREPVPEDEIPESVREYRSANEDEQADGDGSADDDVEEEVGADH